VVLILARLLFAASHVHVRFSALGLSCCYLLVY
jgi:hypothetical protein